MRSFGLLVLVAGCWRGSDPPVATTTTTSEPAVQAPAAVDAVATRDPDPALGERIYQSKGCVSCHSLDGATRVGPSWKGIYGTTVRLGDGSDVVIDDVYIRQSILEPASQLVAGFAPVMPSFNGHLDDEDITDVIAFIKTLR